jgi:outer membrane protein assembly factor BamE (lipoprotein component of BamABCDE complex)
MNHNLIPTLILAILVTGCTPVVDNRGYEIDSRDFKQLIPGQTTKQAVEEAFGSPSTISAFKPETWFYISRQMETKAFLAPTTTDLTIYEVSFNDADIVTKVVERKGEQAREIKPVKRETPSSGHQSGLLREMFSNFGRISSKGEPNKGG